MRKVTIYLKEDRQWDAYIESGPNYVTVNEGNLEDKVYKAGWEAYRDAQTALGMTVNVIDMKV
jgi:hypothetical protein